MTEKRKPAYDLVVFKAASADPDTLKVTITAVRSAAALGFDRAGIVATLQTMQPRQFYKSMTSYGNRQVWQDVYHVPSAVGTLYIKFTADVLSDYVLLSFKEKHSG